MLRSEQRLQELVEFQRVVLRRGQRHVSVGPGCSWGLSIPRARVYPALPDIPQTLAFPRSGYARDLSKQGYTGAWVCSDTACARGPGTHGTVASPRPGYTLVPGESVTRVSPGPTGQGGAGGGRVENVSQVR
jgi:hypothetical protein